MWIVYESFQTESCVLWGKLRDFSLECTSVGQNCILIQCIFSCAINMYVFRLLGYLWLCYSLMTLLFPPQVRCGSGNVRCQLRNHWCIFQALTQSVIRGSAAFTTPHNRARYKDVTVLWFFKAFDSNDIFHFHFAFRVPYIYACFYNVSFNIMYPLSNLGI